MRSPPPIPRLRRDLRVMIHTDRVEVHDSARGVTHRFEGEAFARLVPLLRVSPPSQADLARSLQLPRLRVQRMVLELISHQLFLTPRAIEQATIARRRRAFRRPPKSGLLAGEELRPLERSRIRRALSRALRGPGAMPTRLVLAFALLEDCLDKRHRAFDPFEVFATRDAFHIVRPDPTEAPERLRTAIEALIDDASKLPEPWRVAVTQVLTQVDLREGPALPRALVRIFLHGIGIFGSVSWFMGLAMLFLLQRVMTIVSLPSDLPTFFAWASQAGDRVADVFGVSCRVLVGLGSPPARPAWWVEP